MPSLAQTLPANDLGFLRIVATLWGLELASSAPAEAALELAEAMLDAELMEEVISTLPEAAQAALQTLFNARGRLVWVQFARRYGEIREMGPGKRDREQPHTRPNSAAETLYYRALIGKAFFETPSGSQEFSFIPDDLMQALEFIGFEAGAAPALEPEPEPKPAPVKPAQPAPPAAPEPEYADFDEAGDESEAERVIFPTVGSTINPVSSMTSAKKPPVVARPTPPPPPVAAPGGTLGRAATPTEKAHILPATDFLLDDLTTLLAALRLGIEPPALAVPIPVLTGLLATSRLISGNQLQPEAVKTFLAAPRDQALAATVEAWQGSDKFNELRQIPGLACEGGWQNQPLVTREFLLNLLEPLPEGVWWSLPAFVRDVKQKYPDFQRPAGDYDTWFIKRLADGQYLRGFNHWDEVDGALIRYFLQVLHWLGQIDLATAEESGIPTAFRIAKTELQITNYENEKITVTSQGKIVVPRLAPRAARYQIARFCDWETSPNSDEYRYRVTPASLKRAAEQGLKVSHLLSLLAKASGGQVPPVFVKALQRWETNGTEARVETLTVLKVSKPEVLNELRASKAARFLGEIIGPTTVVLQSGAEAKVMGILAELGLLAEYESGDSHL